MPAFVNTPLPYAYDALEPYIDAETMELHHQKHLGAYIDTLNAALADFPALECCPAGALSVMSAPMPWRAHLAINRSSGGVFNHRFFFCGMTPDRERQQLCGTLSVALMRRWRTQTAFEEAFLDTALSVFGSGYAWLALDRGGHLMLTTTQNQETPMARGLRPVLCCDVWEHAYYLKRQNRRADYVRAFLHVIDWTRAEALYSGEITLEKE